MLAHDATTKQDSSGYVNSLTFSHTCTGSDLVLIVQVACRTGSADITGVTYNGVSMTKEDDTENTNVCGVQTYSLINPATGANNVVVSLGGYKLLTGVATSFSGANQTDAVEAINGSNTGYSAAPSNAVTTITNDAIVIDGLNCQGARTVTVGSGQTERNNSDHSDGNLGQFVISTEPKTTAGSVTMSHSWTGDDNWAQSLLVVKPAAAASGSIAKTNGVAWASIGKINGVAEASIGKVCSVSN